MAPPPVKAKPVFREFVSKDGAGKELGLLQATLEQGLRSVRGELQLQRRFVSHRHANMAAACRIPVGQDCPLR